MKLSQLLSSLLILQCYSDVVKDEPILIIALPKSDTAEVSASWERGGEILLGALKAIHEAKNCSLLLNLTLFVATSARQGFSYSGNISEIIVNLTRQKRVSDIVGIAGVFHPNILDIISRFQLPTASLIHFDEVPHGSSIHYLTASISTLADSILAFLNVIHPKKFEIITEMEESNYLMVSHQLSTKANTVLNVSIQVVNKYHPFSTILDRIFDFNIHAILLSASPSTALSILCEAYKRGLTWPKYAWILHSYRLDDLLQSSMSLSKGCGVQEILEGIYIFQLTSEEIELEGAHYDMTNGGVNPYALLLHDSVWNLISTAANRSHSHSIEVTSPGHFKSESDIADSSKVYIYHNLNSTANRIGIYDDKLGTLTNMSEIIFTDYDLPVVNRVAVLVPYLLPLPILCMVFNTILLVLYIVFRNEPSIKSTSVSLSMLMLIGCYILIGYSIFLMVDELYPFDLCMVHIWLSGIGLSIPLIFATILMKMLRVYRIFTAFEVLKRSTHLSDFYLFVYTILIVSPQILLMILWTAVDPRYRNDKLIEHPGYIEEDVYCQSSDYEVVWFALGFSYLFLLSVAVIIVAIKSRNIRLARFKDTKKVNLLIFLLYAVGLSVFSYWRILSASGFVIPSFIILYAGHVVMALLCQVALFVPKIWPAILKKACYAYTRHIM